SSSLRSLTFELTNPDPIGVMTGPLSATLFRLIESIRSLGSGSPYLVRASAPTTKDSHSSWTPAARRTETVAPATSGPIPSPGIRLIFCSIQRLLAGRAPPAKRVRIQAESAPGKASQEERQSPKAVLLTGWELPVSPAPAGQYDCRNGTRHSPCPSGAVRL